MSWESGRNYPFGLYAILGWIATLNYYYIQHLFCELSGNTSHIMYKNIVYSCNHFGHHGNISKYQYQSTGVFCFWYVWEREGEDMKLLPWLRLRFKQYEGLCATAFAQMITTTDEEAATCMLFTAANVAWTWLGECCDVQKSWMAKIPWKSV